MRAAGRGPLHLLLPPKFLTGASTSWFSLFSLCTVGAFVRVREGRRVESSYRTCETFFPDRVTTNEPRAGKKESMDFAVAAAAAVATRARSDLASFFERFSRRVAAAAAAAAQIALLV